MDAQKVGRRIQEARKARGLTQAELAQMVDLSTKYISNVECGFKTPKLNTFVAIANALQCDANQLLADVLDVIRGVGIFFCFLLQDSAYFDCIPEYNKYC